MNPVTIVLADDHALVRQGIKRIIEENPRYLVINEAEDGVELLSILESCHPDIVVLDLSMPRLQGLEAAEYIRQLYPDMKIIILTMHRKRDYFRRAMDIGVHGYILKEDVDEALNHAILAVADGKTYVSSLI